MLRTHQEVHGSDAMAMEAGPKVSLTQASFLVARFTREEIKSALFDIGNDKSPGRIDIHHNSSKRLGILWGMISVQQLRNSLNLENC